MAAPGFKLNKDGKVYKNDRKVFQNKDIYEGEFVGGKMHGFGVLLVHNGDKYTGEFLNNLFHGKGVYDYAAYNDLHGNLIGSGRYDGYYVRGRKEGQGIYHLRNGDIYTGEFENDLFHGSGSLKKSNGDIINGSFARGRANGHCEIKYANGDVYVGNLVRDQYSGQGKLMYRDNKGSYEGSWRLGKQHGKGVRLFVNGNKYVGDFFNGVIEGGGIMAFANGNQYAGDWKSGHMDGNGVLRFAHGDTYEGGFLRGFFYNQGKYTWADGGYYEGEYITTFTPKSSLDSVLDRKVKVMLPFPRPDGLRNGKGTRVWVNGNRYDGDWQKDLMHGAGVLTKSVGGTYTGSFWKGSRHGYGIETFGNIMNMKYRCPMGHNHKGDGFCQYTGPFKLNYFEGEGSFVCVDGRTYIGQWVRGKRQGQGTQTYVREGDMGDPERLYIGGVGSLYRVQSHKGSWDDDKIEGEGESTLFNNDKVIGKFKSGQPDGLVLIKWAASKTFRERYARYQRGQRVEWAHENTQILRKLHKLLSMQSTLSKSDFDA